MEWSLFQDSEETIHSVEKNDTSYESQADFHWEKYSNSKSLLNWSLKLWDVNAQVINGEVEEDQVKKGMDTRHISGSTKIKWVDINSDGAIYRIVASRSTSRLVTPHVTNWKKIKNVRMSWKKKLLDKHIIRLSSHYLQNLSIFTNKKVLFLKEICSMLVFETLKNKKSDFLNSNTC